MYDRLSGKWGRILNSFFAIGTIVWVFGNLQFANAISLDDPVTFRLMWALIIWGGILSLFPNPTWSVSSFAYAFAFGGVLTFIVVLLVQATVWWVRTGTRLDNMGWAYMATAVCLPGMYFVFQYLMQKDLKKFDKRAVKEVAIGRPILSFVTALLSVISVLLLLFLRSGVPLSTFLGASGE